MPGFQFDRIDLRDSMVFTEWDYERTDPRELLGHVKRSIQEVTAGNDFKYDTHEPSGSNPSVSSEPVGSQPGRVTGRLTATTPWTKFYTGEVVSEESHTLAAVLGVVGGLVLLFGLSDGNNGLAVGGGVLLAFAAALYYNDDQNTKRRTFYYRKNARVLLTGNVGATNPDAGDPGTLESTDLTLTCGERIEVMMDRGTEENATIPIEDLPDDVRSRLETSFTALNDEVDFGVDGGEQFTHRATDVIGAAGQTTGRERHQPEASAR